MGNTTDKIIEVFNVNCNTLRERQETVLLKEKRKLFRECYDEINDVNDKGHNILAVEKFKSLLFKVEDHNQFVLQELLEYETKRFLKAMYANILINNKDEIYQLHSKELQYDLEALEFLTRMIDEKEFIDEVEEVVETPKIIEEVKEDKQIDDLSDLMKELEAMI
jgi:hypothetical protein